MKISDKGKAHIKKWEGLRLRAYQCSAEVWTIGYGHTGPEVYPGLVISEVLADKWFEQDIVKFEKGAKITGSDKLTQAQFDMIVSFAFNVGIDAFQKSTMASMIRAGQIKSAGEQFLRWVYAKGKKVGGLVNRRTAERKVFLNGW